MNSCYNVALCCAILFLMSFILTYLVRKWAIHKSILDHPNDRSSHSIPTPRGGGIAIAATWFLGITYMYFNNWLNAQLFFALICGFPLVIVGFLDDVLNLKPSIRFIVQFTCTIGAIALLNGLQLISFGFYNFNYTWVLTVLAIFATVWSINLFNFLDGIDGYISAGVIFICMAGFLLIREPVFIVLSLSVLGFLCWNWPKAKIFMGDVSSTLLGYNVAVLAIYFQNTNKTSLLVWLIITSVFWFDATVTLIRRFKNKENLGEAHRKHAFQRIVQAGFSHKKTLLYMLLINAFIFCLAFVAYTFPNYALLMLAINIILLKYVLGIIDRKKPFELS